MTYFPLWYPLYVIGNFVLLHINAPQDAHECKWKMSQRDCIRRWKAVKSLMSERFRELMRTCPLCSNVYVK
ncbi:hypothetical protein C8E03_11619 [Lachnotalea glycerini]|uniref:Uncharacterized protein n=1 Tax=Lachnotalea glycerini TaxID=1763509 RepID=A0A255IQP4_9FIRM|nr:hypothetical protein C8E03_11619 [Lachnotalea glycerini]RDY31125.1 hypothetical protein CG710_011080 [Lachnotalea glycerini]